MPPSRITRTAFLFRDSKLTRVYAVRLKMVPKKCLAVAAEDELSTYVIAR